MKIFVKVKAGAKENMVEEVDEKHLKVSVKARPQEGKANMEVIKVLAGYFKTVLSEIQIVSGLKSKNKVIKINFEKSN